MNLTKGLHDYSNTINQTFNTQEFRFKIEKYGCLDKCTQIMYQLKSVESQLKNLVQMSKTSSLFNETHLKFTKIGNEIESSLKIIEKSINKIANEDFHKYSKNNFEKKVVQNSIDLLQIKLENLGASYQKFLKTQAEMIRQIEKRKANLVNTKSKRPKPKNDDLYSNSTDADGENLPFTSNSSQLVYDKHDNSNYQVERSSAVQHIEKAMSDLNSLFNRVSEMVYRQRDMVERISNDTDISYTNMIMAESEVIKLKDTVKDNRRLILKIFGIIVFFVVIYIVLIN